jgi:hypothetical protein
LGADGGSVGCHLLADVRGELSKQFKITLKMRALLVYELLRDLS